MTGAYQQLGYVTNDFDRAMALFAEVYGISSFKQMRDLTIGARNGMTVTAHFGLAFKDATQFEIIQPLAGDAAFYAEVVEGADFAIRFHHLGHYYPDPTAYAAAKARCAARWDLSINVAIFDGAYAYFDARPDLGHYQELYTFPPETHFDGVPWH